MREMKLTGVRLGNEEENESFLSGESRDVDVLIFLVLQSIARKGVSNVNSREIYAGRSFCGFVEFSLRAMLNISVHGELTGGYSNLFRAVFLVVIVLCVVFIDISLFAGSGGFFGWFRRLLSWLWLGGDSSRPARRLSLCGVSVLSDFGRCFAGHK